MGIQITSDEKLRAFERVNELAGGGKLEIVNGKTIKKCIDIPCYTKELVDAILNTYIKVGIVYSPSNSVAVSQKVQSQLVEDYLYQNNSIVSDATQGRIQAVLSAYNAVRSSANTKTAGTAVNTPSASTSSSSKSNNSTSGTKTTNTASNSNIDKSVLEINPEEETSFFSKHFGKIAVVGIAVVIIAAEINYRQQRKRELQQLILDEQPYRLNDGKRKYKRNNSIQRNARKRK